MLNKRSLLQAALVLCASASFSQSFFQQAYGPMVTSGAFQTSLAVRHADGSWTMRGSVDDPTTLLHLNADGTTQWISDFNSPEISMVGLIASTAASADNSIIALFADTLEYLGGGVSRRRVGVARIASNGAVEWAKRHYYDVPGNILAPSDGHQVAVDTDGSFFLDGGEPSAPSVMRFTSNGTLSWARVLNDPDGVGHIDGLAADGTGGCYFLGGYTSAFQDSSVIIIGRFNSSGDLVWNTKYEAAQAGRILEPLKLLRRTNGNLLITAREYGGGVIGTSGVLLEISGAGTPQWAKAYWFNTSGTLYIYNTLERSDGQLWMDFQAGGYGFARLSAPGAVQQADRFTYQSLGNSTGVVGWEETLMHNDEIGVVGAYYIDQNWTSYDPRTEFVWNLNAFDLGLCATDPVTITQNVLPASAFITSSTTTASEFTVTEDPMTLTPTGLTAPATLPFCSLYVGVEEQEDGPQLMVHPTLISAGAAFTVQTSERMDVEVVDALGRTVVQRLSIMAGTRQAISTAGWARGMYLIRGSDAGRATSRPVKLMVE